METITNEQIWVRFGNLTPEKQVTVLSNALDYMQQYNGREKVECIAYAMGFDGFSDEFVKR